MSFKLKVTHTNIHTDNHHSYIEYIFNKRVSVSIININCNNFKINYCDNNNWSNAGSFQINSEKLILEFPINCTKIKIFPIIENCIFYGLLEKTIQAKLFNEYKLYYYNFDWQIPVITEQRIYDLFTYQKKIPLNYFAFPWATLIDQYLYEKKYALYNLLINFKVSENECFTVMQHIHFRKFLKLVKKINITHVFTPHVMRNDYLIEKEFNIKIIPLSLFPVQCKTYQPISRFDQRKYLASFIGNHTDKHYMTDIRVKIFDEFKYNDCFIHRNNEWYYQSIVYKKKQEFDKLNDENYKSNLEATKFTLCPSGSGPNSIRMWEAMSFGSIPVILSDELVLPDIVDFNECSIIYKEDEIGSLYNILRDINAEKWKKMSDKCIEYYKKYFSKYSMHQQIIEHFKKIEV